MPATRPGTVTFVAVLAYINGVLNIVGGVVILFTRDQMVRASNGGTEAGLITSAILAIILGVVILVVARGLLNGSRFARGLVTVVMILNAVGGVILLFSLQFFSGILEILWAIVMLSLLYTQRANAFFASRG
ncbi:DUF7144 family membrane protein [Leifsonia shinshuensis]|uniref:DUF7144 domain-containing protein n=1 Tax=Leifsonia shinshuensis TaxID=150026 RepID=A0A7G6Y8N8_9MICO|nr:hypothetical protein [Leifsonia shinshuensis]QNE34853.1 hypothetical protein F1C12_06745 [Leifsonia shinshuensis]